MRMRKCIGCIAVLLCLFSSCPDTQGSFKIRVNNDTSSLNVNRVQAANIGDNGAGTSSDDFLDSVLFAGESRTLTVRLREVGSGNGIWVFMSGDRDYRAIVPGGYRNGIVVVVNLTDNGTGGATMSVRVE